MLARRRRTHGALDSRTLRHCQRFEKFLESVSNAARNDE